MESDKVKVAVRVRPLPPPDKDGNPCTDKVVVKMQGNQVILGPPTNERDKHKIPKAYTFDHCFCSMDRNDPFYADQEKVFQCLGVDMVEQALQGYNGCIFAYGNTGSGKSYTMMGSGEVETEKGLIPRLCDYLFQRLDTKKQEDPSLSYGVDISYLEVYNEKVYDLLPGEKVPLQVKDHKGTVVVEGLKNVAVYSFAEMKELMKVGNLTRTIASTNANKESSRSHAVFTIVIRQEYTEEGGKECVKSSKLSLVDLAGSEKIKNTKAEGKTAKEGSQINQSLTCLGRVIRELAKKDTKKDGKKDGKKEETFISYRDSKLTFLLRDNLGGNSKTAMIATINPTAHFYEETKSTLLFADSAKSIVNCAVVNEKTNLDRNLELQSEIEKLRAELATLKDKHEKERMMNRLQMTEVSNERVGQALNVIKAFKETWKRMGFSEYHANDPVNKECPHLINLQEDPQYSDLFVIYLRGRMLVGRADAPVDQDIQLDGLGIHPQHAVVEVEGQDAFLTPQEGAETCINGSVITERQKLNHGDRVVMGNNYFFRFSSPTSDTSGESPLRFEERHRDQGYRLAQEELMEKGSNTAFQAFHALQRQYMQGGEEASQQKQKFEEIRNKVASPGTPSSGLGLPLFQQAGTPLRASTTSLNTSASNTDMVRLKFQERKRERSENIDQFMGDLKQELVKANSLVREANMLSKEMGKRTEFQVTLQIPAANLYYNKWKASFICEPAIVVKRKNRSRQIWTMEKMENKIVDMRDMYTDRCTEGLPMMVDSSCADSDDDDDDDEDAWVGVVFALHGFSPLFLFFFSVLPVHD